MIYSTEINKICAVCQMAKMHNDDTMYCEVKKSVVPLTDTACEKFKYDIMKKRVRRMRRLKTDFKAEDFTL